jgi:group I intron endonuclease
MSNSNKSKKYHFVYKTTNLLNNKFYVGMHSTTNLNDGYIGSGTNLRFAIRKYGPNNFKFEILEWCINREELIKREKEIINENFLNDPNCYNLKPGGTGGFNNPTHQYKCSKAAGIKHREMLKSDPNYRKKISLSRIASNEKNHKNGKLKSIQDSYSWLGKKHNEETKKKIGEKNSISQKGNKNSQFGTKWITNGYENKKIKKTEPLPLNWVYGITKLK